MKCTNCKNEFEGKFCPKCGTPVVVLESNTSGKTESSTSAYSYSSNVNESTPQRKKGGCLKVALIVIGVIVVLFVAIGTLGKENKEKSNNTKPKTSQVADTNESTEEATTKESESVPEDEPDVPTEYKSALSKAKSYSETMFMSKQGLYDQLTAEYGEQFSAEAAQYAIDNLKADYNANALAKAESYSETMYMSKQGIYDQLTSEYGEQFSAEEAQYAVDNLKADYKANALEKAKSYQDSMSMSPEAIRDQLTSEYGEQFTAEEADYAIANLN